MNSRKYGMHMLLGPVIEVLYILYHVLFAEPLGSAVVFKKRLCAIAQSESMDGIGLKGCFGVLGGTFFEESPIDAPWQMGRFMFGDLGGVDSYGQVAKMRGLGMRVVRRLNG